MFTRTLPAWARRLLKRELTSAINGCAFDESAARKLLALLAPQRKNEKQKKTIRRKSEGSLRSRLSTAEVRAVVMKRANGVCEARGCLVSAFFLQLDHWHGGSGRRRQREAVETTWALCRGCHADRTRNDPDAAYWNDRFREHCAKYGYPFVGHVEHAELPRRAAR